VRVRRLSCFVLLACVCFADGAHAEDAGQLFDRGLKDMLKGRYETGCTLIAQSQQLDPQPGTLFTLAECYRKAGKLATAIERYTEYITLYETLPTKQKRAHKERQQISIKDRASLLDVVPRISLVLPDNAPKGTVVTKDGVALQRDALKDALLVDPGEHVFVTQAPGATPVEQKTTIQKGEQQRFELVVGAATGDPGAQQQLLPEPPSPEPDSQGSANPPPSEGADAGVVQDSGSSQRTWGWVIGGVGVAGVAVGAVTGAVVLSEKNVIESHCPEPDTCDPAAMDEVDAATARADKFGTISTIGFGAGLSLVTVGAVLLLTAPSKPAASSRLVPVVAVAPRQGALVGVTGCF
jgi:hypothetical protein